MSYSAARRTDPDADQSRQRVFLLCVARFSTAECLATLSFHHRLTTGAVRALLERTGTSTEPEERQTVMSDHFAIHYVVDDRNRVFLAVTDSAYPGSAAFRMVDETRTCFLAKCDSASHTAKPDSLSRTMFHEFTRICATYNQPRNIGRLAAVAEKIDITTSVMAANISQMLLNDAMLESIDDTAAILVDQSSEFKTSSKAAARAMWRKKVFNQAVVALACLCVVGILIAVVVVWTDTGTGEAAPGGPGAGAVVPLEYEPEIYYDSAPPTAAPPGGGVGPASTPRGLRDREG